MSNPAHLAQAFELHAEASPDAMAVVVGDDRWTRAEFADLAGRAAAALEDLGARPGATVVSQYRTDPEDLALALAASRMGCTFVPLPVRLGSYEVSRVLELTRPVLLTLHKPEIADELTLPD